MKPGLVRFGLGWVMAAGAGGLSAVEPLSLPAAIVRLQAESPRLHAARAEVARRHAERQATDSQRWPQVDLSARYTQLNSPVEIDLSGLRTVMLGLHPEVPPGVVPGFRLPLRDERFASGQLTATWPVYAGGRIAAARDAAAAVEVEAQHRARLAEEGLLSELARRYFGARLARRAVATYQKVLEGLDTHVYQAQRLEAEGMIARTERLHADVAQAEGRRLLLRAQGDARIAEQVLAALLGSEAPVAPTTELFFAPQIEAPEWFRSRALQFNPELAALVARARQTSAGERAERGRYRPEVFLFGQRELIPGDLTALEPEWAVGVGARWTVIDRAGRRARVEAARQAGQQVAWLQRQAEQEVGLLVARRYEELRQALNQREALLAALTQAQENLRVRQIAFTAGQSTSVEVVDARLALARVELEHLRAAYEFGVALAGLLEVSGEAGRLPEYLARAEFVGTGGDDL